MKKILSLIVGCLISVGVIAQSYDSIRVTGVVDGDTLRASIDGFPEPLNKVLIRINGVDTPELKGKCKKEKEMALAAKKFLTDELSSANAISLKDLKWDKYGGRILADVYFDEESVRELLIEKGFAVSYHGEKKIDHWCNR